MSHSTPDLRRGDCHRATNCDWDNHPTYFIRRHQVALRPFHRWLTRLLPVPGSCFLNLLHLRKRGLD